MEVLRGRYLLERVGGTLGVDEDDGLARHGLVRVRGEG